MCTEYYMSPAACEIMNSPQNIPWLQTITGDYRAWLRLHQVGESVITITIMIMITQKM